MRRLTIALVLATVVLALASTAAANPDTQWLLPASLKSAILGPGFPLLRCDGCGYVKVRVTAVSVRTLGRARVVDGEHRFQHFDVLICGTDYTQGGELIHARMYVHAGYLWTAAKAARLSALAAEFQKYRTLGLSGQLTAEQRARVQAIIGEEQRLKDEKAGAGLRIVDWQNRVTDPVMHAGC